MRNYTKILTISFLLASCFSMAQIAIGKEDVSNVNVLLEFGSDAKGIILPSVETAPGAVGGTFIFDLTDNSVKVIEERNEGANGNWTNMTDNAQAGTAHAFLNGGTDVGEGVVMGADETTKPGALVLESTTGAMVLPHIENPHLTMPGVIAGTIVYDSAADMIAVFDGSNWSYWK